jgi:hypothetical protein
MSGKGRGKHIGRKNKRSRHLMQESRNKARIASSYQKRLETIQIKGMERDELLVSALTILSIKKASLQKLIGTLNARRLRAVVENKYLAAPWFVERTARRQERKYVRKSSSSNTPRINAGTDTPNGDTQVVSGS